MRALHPQFARRLLGGFVTCAAMLVIACGSSGAPAPGSVSNDEGGNEGGGASDASAPPTDSPRDDADGGRDAASLPGIQGFAAGTNLSGGEFGSPPGVFGTDYTYPTHAEVDYFTGKGFRVLRIPFLWERIEPALGQPLDPAELARLSDLVTYATSKGAYAVVDPHNYARYRGSIIGDADAGTVSAAQFATFWGMLANAFAGNPRVVFGLMNEPHDMATELWLDDANAAIAAIRAAGAENMIFVPGNGWTGAHSWTDGSGGAASSVVMLGVHDPIDNFVYEVHQYLDSDSSGTHPECVSATIGSERLKLFTEWMTAHHVRGFLGEFGAANNPTCLSAIADMLTYIDRHRDGWVGWTWWSAGSWWGNYMFSIEPMSGLDAPQMATLVPHL